jgi:hypothetical protein
MKLNHHFQAVPMLCAENMQVQRCLSFAMQMDHEALLDALESRDMSDIPGWVGDSFD